MKELKFTVPKDLPELKNVVKNKSDYEKLLVLLYFIGGIKKHMIKVDTFAPEIDRSSGWLPLPTQSLKKLIHDYPRIRQLAEENNIIEVKRKDDGTLSYMPKQYSSLIRLNSNSKECRFEKITNPVVLSRIEKYFKQDYLRQIKSATKNAKYYHKCIDFINELRLINQQEQDDSSSDKFIEGFGRHISRDLYGDRIHTHISSLDKKDRANLRLANSEEPLFIVDVKSSQPYFLSLILNYPSLIETFAPEFNSITGIIRSYNQSEDFKLMLKDTSDGAFYHRIGEPFKLSKDQLKRDLFHHVLYCSSYEPKQEDTVYDARNFTRTVFRSRYPTVLSCIDQVKKIKIKYFPFVDDLNKQRNKKVRPFTLLNMLCQRIESRILLDKITAELVERGVGSATIHDAWILKESDVSVLKEVVQFVFERLGVFAPMLDVKPLNDAS
jgi:hypothetical protein